MRPILVPLDGSDLAARALPLAVSLARPTGASLVLVRVPPQPPVVPLPEPTSLRAVLEQQQAATREAEAELRTVAAQLRTDSLEVEEVVERGESAASVIVRTAESRGAWLIVMSTHGRGGLVRTVLGSVTERVLRESTVPVVVVPPRFRPDTPA